MKTGREIVCLYPDRIHNIKYIYGVKPRSFFIIDRPRITLFYVAAVSEAQNIQDNQEIPRTNGPFGEGHYLYYTLTDAVQHCSNPGNEELTYLACDSYLNDFHDLKHGEKVHRGSFRSFRGVKNNCQYYIFTDKSLVCRIHYCGGQPWQEGGSA